MNQNLLRQFFSSSSISSNQRSIKNKLFIFNKISLLLLLCFTFFINTAKSQNLVAGDMVVLGIDAVNDRVTFATLVDIPANTVIKITDKGWYGNAFTTFSTGDGIVTWTTTSTISAGTVLTLTLGGSDNNPANNLTNVTANNADLTSQISVSTYTITDPFNTAGDQIFIYQGNDSNPYFIFGFNNSAGTNIGTDGWNNDIPAFLPLRDSYLPNGTGSQNALTNGVNALAMPGGTNQKDVVGYTGLITSADVSTWLARFTNVGNWSGDDAAITPVITTASGSIINIAGPPIAAIVVADNALRIGETTMVTIIFSEAVSGFTNADLTIVNGTLSAVSSVDGGITWTATFTPTTNSTDATNIIVLDNTGIVDLAGNAGTGTTESNNYAIDTARPTATIVVADNALAVGETSLVTITFSEAVSGFTNADLAVANGTLSAVSSADGGTTWTATFTPTAGVNDNTNLIVLNNTGIADLAGNAGSGTTSSNNYAIDTMRPTATIVVADNALRIGETTMVTITFSEAVSGFTLADLIVANGMLSGLSSSDGGITWTATFTPTADIEATTNTIDLDNTGVTDAAGNAGSGTSSSDNYVIDTKAPEIPTALVASFGDTQNELNWTANTETDIASYKVYGGTSANPTNLLQTVTAPAVTYTHTGLTNGTTYYYHIIAADNAGNQSLASAEVSAIPKATPIITFNALANKTYGDVDFNPAASSTNIGTTITYTSSNTAVATIVSGKVHIVGVGNTIITAKQVADAAHTAATDKEQELTVDAKAITATAQAVSKTYDGTVTATITFNAFTTANGLVDADDVGVTYASASYNNKHVNTGKSITINGLELTGTAKENYSLNPFSITGAITAKSINVTAQADSRTYDGTAISSVLPAVDALETSDVITVQPNQSFDNRNVGTGKTLNPSVLEINDGNGGNNYNIQYISKQIGEISPATLTYVAVSSTKIYGDDNPVLTGTVIGFITGDNQSNATTGGPLNFATTATNQSGAGSYAIIGSGLAANNYVFEQASTNTTAFTINKALLTVIANPAQRCYGDSNPTFTVSYNGFKNSDNVNSLTQLPTATTIANEDSPAGTYELSVSGGEAANYTFHYENGLFTVNALPVITITSDKGDNVSRGEYLTLTASGGTEYQWTTLGIPTGQTGPEFRSLRPLSTTTYVVHVKDANGCESTASYTVESKDDYRTIEAENFITPNGDGVNDTWVVKNIDAYSAHTLTIVDRAGRVIYKTRDYQNDWAGTLDASPLQKGTYYYIFQFDQPDVGAIKGFITIVR